MKYVFSKTGEGDLQLEVKPWDDLDLRIVKGIVKEDG